MAKQGQLKLWLIQQKHSHKFAGIGNKFVHNTQLGAEIRDPSLRMRGEERSLCKIPYSLLLIFRQQFPFFPFSITARQSEPSASAREGTQPHVCPRRDFTLSPPLLGSRSCRPTDGGANGKERARGGWLENRQRLVFTSRTHPFTKIQREKSGSPRVNSRPCQVSAQPDYFAVFSSFSIFFSEGRSFTCPFCLIQPQISHTAPITHTCLSPWVFPLNQNLSTQTDIVFFWSHIPDFKEKGEQTIFLDQYAI